MIFAGAGISTEVSTVFPSTVLEMAASRLEIELDEAASFPQVLEEFQNRFGRAELVRMISEKFDFIDSFRGPRYNATRFHRELQTMPYLRDVVTTNWDTYFEDVAGARPFLSGEDIALWETPGRRVIKVHGSISSLGSIVATESDYAKRLERLGSDVMGALLRQLLATKTVVFAGYSLRDWNFRRLYEALQTDMKEFAPAAYVVDPFADGEENDLGMTILRTSGTHFLERLKSELVGHCNIGDEAYDSVATLMEKALDADPRTWDDKISHVTYPAVAYTWFYNDGMRDACQRILRRRRTGEYSDRHHVISLLKSYDTLIDRAGELGHYHDVAYLEGYVTGLFSLLDDEWERDEWAREHSEERRPIADEAPLYFIFGSESDMLTRGDLLGALELSRRRAPKQRAHARAVLEGVPDGMILAHSPFLASNLLMLD